MNETETWSLPAPSFHVQNTMVAGDYGFWEMGKETYQYLTFCNLHSCFVNLHLLLSCFISQTNFRPEGDLQQIWGEGQYGKDGSSFARASSLAQEKGVLLISDDYL